MRHIENQIEFISKLEGKCISLKVNGKSVGVFSEFSDKNPTYHGLSEAFNIVILTNYTEVLSALYCLDTTVSYTYYGEFANAETRGNIKYYL